MTADHDHVAPHDSATPKEEAEMCNKRICLILLVVILLVVLCIVLLSAREYQSQQEYIIIKRERYSTDLTKFSSCCNNLQDEDIVPLRHMTNLTELYLLNNQIIDLTPLSALTNLRRLELRDNPITDWSPVKHVPQVAGRP